MRENMIFDSCNEASLKFEPLCTVQCHDLNPIFSRFFDFCRKKLFTKSCIRNEILQRGIFFFLFVLSERIDALLDVFPFKLSCRFAFYLFFNRFFVLKSFQQPNERLRLRVFFKTLLCQFNQSDKSADSTDPPRMAPVGPFSRRDLLKDLPK